MNTTSGAIVGIFCAVAVASDGGALRLFGKTDCDFTLPIRYGSIFLHGAVQNLIIVSVYNING